MRSAGISFAKSLACFSLLLTVITTQTALAEDETPRIISADLGTTQVLQALNLQDAIIAVDVTSVRQPELRGLPSIGYHRQLSPEGLLSIKADALVGAADMGPETAINALEKTGVQIIQQEPPKTIDTLIENVRTLSTEFNHKEDGEKLINIIEEMRTTLSNTSVKQKTAIFLLDMGGHGGANGSMAGQGTGGDAFLNLLGLENMAKFPAYREASRESLIALNPDVIVLASGGRPSKGPKLEDSEVIALTRAAKEKNIMGMNASTLVAGLSVAAMDEAIRVKTTLAKK
ncbi:MAG: ABC transporter substrate-binding protein [Oleiphilaceae bacterium]|nr:ABC transporter substrate-binding protein [Oleiphilaceae bacterium]